MAEVTWARPEICQDRGFHLVGGRRVTRAQKDLGGERTGEARRRGVDGTGKGEGVCAGDIAERDASAAHKGGRNNVDLNQQGSRPRGKE